MVTVRAGAPLSKETCLYPSASELTLDNTTAPLALKMLPSHLHSVACTFQTCICFFHLRLNFSVPAQQELYRQLFFDILKAGGGVGVGVGVGVGEEGLKKMTPLISQARASLGGEGLNYW